MPPPRKKDLFNLFAANLEAVKRLSKIKFKGSLTTGYVCPLCNKVFSNSALNPEHHNHLTEEHVPPHSLGGEVRLLLCKSCNNKAGTTLDAPLFETLKELDFIQKVSGASKRTRLKVNEELNLDAIFSESSDGYKFEVLQRSSNHNDYKKIFQSSGFEFKEFQAKILLVNKTREATIAKYRIAYLLLYSTMGVALLANDNIHAIRNQIITPRKKLAENLPVFDVSTFNFEDGIYIVKKPAALRSFAVIFSLYTQVKRSFMILLPGPSDPGLAIYKSAVEMTQDNNNVDFRMTYLNDANIINNDSKAFWYFELWNRIK